MKCVWALSRPLRAHSQTFPLQPLRQQRTLSLCSGGLHHQAHCCRWWNDGGQGALWVFIVVHLTIFLTDKCVSYYLSAKSSPPVLCRMRRINDRGGSRPSRSKSSMSRDPNERTSGSFCAGLGQMERDRIRWIDQMRFITPFLPDLIRENPEKD